MEIEQPKYGYDKLFKSLINETSPTKDNLIQRIKLCAESGILRHAISKKYGGHGDTFVNLCRIYEDLGSEILDNGLILALNAHIWGSVFPLIFFGSIEQQGTYLEKLLNGSYIGGHAITESEVGSDISSITTEAKKVENGYILNGHKKYITNAPIADLIIIYARHEENLSAFLVNTKVKGVNVNCLNLDGFYSSSIGEVKLVECFVPESYMLGKAGAGMSILQKALELERAFIFSGIVGAMKKHLTTIVTRTYKRKVQNRPLIKNQTITHKIAEMSLDLETIRLWIYKCAKMKDENQKISLASSYVKLCASDLCLKYYLSAVQIFGASGLEEPYKFSQSVLDALCGRLMSGTNEIQKNIITTLVGGAKKFLPD